MSNTCDVADEDQIAATVDQAVAQFGRLDMAFNNAGIIVPPTSAAEEPAEQSTASTPSTCEESGLV